MRTDIVIATTKSWNIDNFHRLKRKYADAFQFYLVDTPDKLTLDFLERVDPKYIFFPHWSWVVSEKIYAQYECVVFHMTDLPFGRGGSPLQNLIMRQVYETKITALRVDKEIDAGDVYFKVPFRISIGSAEEIYIALSDIIFFEMIPEFLEKDT